MNKPFIFVSCGQYTPQEKSLGQSIVQMVKSVTGLDAFFAEDVHDLAGLDSNILEALRDCSAFITVLHPRGTITRPDGSEHTRASVWIEQEIAIATYIQRLEHRQLPVLAFIHESVGREGLRDLIHLNPIKFCDDGDVLTALPEHLRRWGSLSSAGIELKVETSAPMPDHGHTVRELRVVVSNQTNTTIARYDAQLRVPAAVLKHWRSYDGGEQRSGDSRYREFRFDQQERSSVPPRSERQLYSITYCTRCGVEQFGDAPEIAAAVVADAEVEALLWVEGKEYRASKTIKELSS